jgi:peptide/nickel transport system substrate-binding protein
MVRRFAGLFCPVARPCAITALGFVLLVAPATAQAPASGQPKTGGTVRIGMPTEPSTLNPYAVSTGTTRILTSTTLEGLAGNAPDGTYLPVLAAELPTQANGDVSADGTVVTWKLKPGVTWSDDQPFTSQDVVFTYDVIMNPNSAIANRGDYNVMQSVTAPDNNTVVVTYTQLYAPYLGAFPFIFPAHVFNGQTSIAQDDPFNRAPTVGTGPFVFKSWASGDTIEFDRNPLYRAPGKPYVDQLIYKIAPSKDAAVQALEAGDLDIVYMLDNTFVPQFQTITDASIDPQPSASIESLTLNTSCSSGPQQGDPACPHPVLGDVRVRQAIALAIDKQALTHDLLLDKVKPASSYIPVGPYAVDLGPMDYNPTRAQQLLDQVGWTVGPDGIRVKDGVRAHLSFSTTSDVNLNLEVQQSIQQDLQGIGIETEIRNYPAAVLTGGFPARSPASQGSFDLNLAASGSSGQADPLPTLLGFFGSASIANAQTQSGRNYSRLGDPRLDDALAAAGTTLDDQARLAAFTTASQLILANAANIPLFPALQIDAHKNYVAGWQTNVNAYLTWNVQDWWLNQ